MANKRSYNIGDEIIVTNLERNELYGLTGKVMYVGVDSWGVDVYFESLFRQAPLLNEDIEPVPVKLPTVWVIITIWETIVSIHSSREGAEQGLKELKYRHHHTVVEKEMQP